jgi:hypothetical protein
MRGRNAWCEWTNEQCEPKNCNYAMCRKRQLLDGGICGFSIKRKTKESIRPEDVFSDEIRVRGKVMRKTGERTIF